MLEQHKISVITVKLTLGSNWEKKKGERKKVRIIIRHTSVMLSSSTNRSGNTASDASFSLFAFKTKNQ
jgi:hypothetical protein